MTTSDGRISIDIVANEKGFALQLDSLASMAKGILGKALGAASALGLGKGLVDTATKAIELASAAQQTANRVNAVFPQMADTINNFASRAMYDMGLSGGEAKNMAVQFGMMAQGMGYTEKQAANMSMQMTRLAGDMAAFYGITAEEAQNKLAGVFTGMTRGLKQLGVDMSEANLQAHALSLGITQSVSSMTDAQLAALRLSYAQQQLAVTSGYAQQNLGTWAGQTALLRQQMNALLATMGKGLVAAFLPVLKVINAVIAGLIQVANAFNAMMERITGRSFGQMMGGATGATLALGGAADSAGASTGGLADAQNKAAKAADKQDKAQKKLNRTLAGFDEINKLVSQSTSGSGAGGAGGLGGLGDAIDSLGGFGDMFEGEVEQAQDALDALTIPPALEEAIANLWHKLEGLADTISDGLSWAWEHVLKPFGEWFASDFLPVVLNGVASIVDILDAVLEIVGEAFGPIWDELLAPIAQLIGDAIVYNLQAAVDGLQAMAGWLREHKDEITQPFKDLAELIGLLHDESIKISVIAETQGPVEAIKTLIHDLFDESMPLPDKLDLVISATASMGGPFETIKDWWTWGKENLKDMAGKIGATVNATVAAAWDKAKSAFEFAKSGVLKNITAKVTATIAASVSKAWEKAKAAFKWAKNGLYNKARTLSGTVVTYGMNAINGMKKAWNWARSSLHNITATISLKFNAVVDNIRGWLNSHVASPINWALNKVPLLNWGSRLSFAQGGYVPRNTPKLAVIGDNRREGEIVSPESKFQKMLDQAAGNTAHDAQTLAVLNAILAAIQQSDRAVYLDGKEISRRVVRDVNAITQATGRSPILV